MWTVARFQGWGVVATMALGCSTGVPGDGSFTFNPVTSDSNASTTTGSITTVSIDPTGLPQTNTGRPTDTGRPDDSTGPSDTTGPGLTTTTDPGMTDPGSSGPGGPMCGDGVLDPGEDCDGVDLGGLGCADVDAMFTGGVLACDGACTFDTAGCLSAMNPIVVCQAVNAAIPDLDTNGVTDTIMLPAEGVGVTIADVDVEVEIDHTWIGDLDIDVSSGGTSVTVFNDCGNDDNLHMTFDDSGAAIDCASSDLNQIVQPSNPLSAFNGGAAAADWTLMVEDTASGDTGTLQQWCVTIGWM